jgi:hypothetical protein
MRQSNSQHWLDSIEAEITYLEKMKSLLKGEATYKGKLIGAELDRLQNETIFRLGTRLSRELNENPTFLFKIDDLSFKVSGLATAERNTVNFQEKWASRYTEGLVTNIRSETWRNSPGLFRSYYLSKSSRLLYEVFRRVDTIDLTLDGQLFNLTQKDNYILITGASSMGYEPFSELSYNLLVALGFISGNFLQDEVFTFRISASYNRKAMSIFYQRLRKGGTSIYQALTWNPFGYKGMISHARAEQLYKKETLIPLDPWSFSELAKLILQDHHIKYALVLFNDSIKNSQSLLVKNNCCFIILEVLRKTFFEQVKERLPKDYTNRTHIHKFQMVFEAIAPLTEEEGKLLELRNKFLHGDIRDIEDGEMLRIFHRQLSLIYKLILTHAGFRGHVINHYYLRHGSAKKAFTKLVPGFAD